MNSHPFAKRPLSEFQSITAVCDDCGHAAVLDRGRLMSMTAVPDFETLWRHAYCAPCRLAGAESTSVVLHGMLLDRHREAEPAVKWSEKQVFGEDRSDPYPNLPRRFQD